MYYLNDELAMQLERGTLIKKELEGKLRLRQEAALLMEQAGFRSPGPQNRIRSTVGNFLITSGVRLKGQNDTNANAVAFQVQ